MYNYIHTFMCTPKREGIWGLGHAVSCRNSMIRVKVEKTKVVWYKDLNYNPFLPVPNSQLLIIKIQISNIN